MDNLDTCFFDSLLDIPSDVCRQNPVLDELQLDLEFLQSLPPNLFEGEEVEWISNEDAFQKLEAIGISSLKPTLEPESSGPGSMLEEKTSHCGFLRVPARARSKRPRRRRGTWRLLGLPLAPRQRRCEHCWADKTPQWRAGPSGPKTLCNACGVRYKSGRLVPEYRPASSPTFSSEVHSNSHRKILEMRRLKQG